MYIGTVEASVTYTVLTYRVTGTLVVSVSAINIGMLYIPTYVSQGHLSLRYSDKMTLH